jgi:hypothetical protein
VVKQTKEEKVLRISIRANTVDKADVFLRRDWDAVLQIAVRLELRF